MNECVFTHVAHPLRERRKSTCVFVSLRVAVSVSSSSVCYVCVKREREERKVDVHVCLSKSVVGF